MVASICSRDIISTWIVIDEEGDRSYFPQAGANSSSKKFQEIYWKCIVCFFATSYRIGNPERHVLFTNTTKIPDVSGHSISGLLDRLDTEVVNIPIQHRLGKEKVSAWNNQFYILDILDHVGPSSDFDRLVVLDSDCVWVRKAGELLADIDDWGIVSLCIPYALDHKVNGASRRDMRRAALQLADAELLKEPYYSGGELFAANRKSIEQVRKLAGSMWDRLQASAPGQIQCYEEGHFLSIIYALLDIPVGTADPHIRRLWTALNLYNVSMEDVDSSRCIWHLPTEKKTGFADLFDAVVDPASWFWKSEPEDLRLQLAEVMGIPRRTRTQWARKFQTRAMDHLADWWNRKQHAL